MKYRNSDREIKVGDTFRALVDYRQFKIGDILTCIEPNGFVGPYVKNEVGDTGIMYYNQEDNADEVEFCLAPTVSQIELSTDETQKGEEVKRMNTFKKGDQIKLHCNLEKRSLGCGNLTSWFQNHPTKEYTLTILADISETVESTREWDLRLADGTVRYTRCCSIYLSCFQKVSASMGNFIELTDFQKENWTADTQALYRVGIINADGTIADANKLNAYVLRLNIKALVKQATDDIAKAEAENEKETAKK